MQRSFRFLFTFRRTLRRFDNKNSWNVWGDYVDICVSVSFAYPQLFPDPGSIRRKWTPRRRSSGKRFKKVSSHPVLTTVAFPFHYIPEKQGKRLCVLFTVQLSFVIPRTESSSRNGQRSILSMQISLFLPRNKKIVPIIHSTVSWAGKTQRKITSKHACRNFSKK